MGKLTRLASVKAHPAQFTKASKDARWDKVFGASSKEDSHRRGPPRQGYRTLDATDASLKRLIEAMRSNAPGTWTDDRFEQARHFVGVPYIAIHRMAMQWQQAEFAVFRRDRKHPDGKVPVTEDDSPEGDRTVRPYDLVKLLERPNKKDSFGKMLYRVCQQKYLEGSALIWMLPNELGTPMELYVIPTATAIPQAAINEQYPNGYYRIQPYFPYGPFSSYPTPSTSVGAAIPAEWILDIRFPHPLVNYDGWSPLTAGRLQFDEIESIDRSRWYKMKRSTNPSAVMNFKEMVGAEPLPEPELTRIHAEWENEQEGPENHGKLIVMPPGGELSEWGARPADMEYQAGWSQLVDFGMALIGMTKPAAGMLDTSSYATLFAALKQVHLLVLKPDLEDVAQQFTHRVAPFYGDDLIVEIRCPRIDDDSIKQQKWSILCQNKACKINELRKAFDEPLLEEEWGESRVGEDPQGMMQAASQPMEEAMAAQGMVPAEEGGPPQPPPLSGQEEQQGGPPMPPELRGPGTGKLGEGSLGPRMKKMPNDLRRYALLPEQEEETADKDALRDALNKALLGDGGALFDPGNGRSFIMNDVHNKSLYSKIRKVCANGS